MKPKLGALVLALVGVVFLVAWVKQVVNGESPGFSPALAAALGFFLAAVVALVVKRNSGGS